MTKPVFVFRRRVYLVLMNLLRLPRPAATSIVRGMAILLSPLQLKKRMVGPQVARGALALKVSDDAGYRLFEPNELPGTAELVAECRKLFDEYKSSDKLARRMSEVAKPFLVQVTDSAIELMNRKPIREFLLSDAVINTAIGYMGRVPILSEVQLLWSPVNETSVKSQQYHFDTEDYRQLKIFVNIEDVTNESGPLTLVSSRQSEQIKALTGYGGGRRTRLTDELVEANLGKGEQVSVTGLAGSGIVCDTSRCLHFGSRGNKRERLVLLIQFMDFFAPKVEPVDWSMAEPNLAPAADDVRRQVLNI